MIGYAKSDIADLSRNSNHRAALPRASVEQLFRYSRPGLEIYSSILFHSSRTGVSYPIYLNPLIYTPRIIH